MEAPKLVIACLRQSGYLRVYIAIWLILASLDFAQQTLMSQILSGVTPTDTLRSWTAALILVQPIVRFGMFGRMLSNITASAVNILSHRFLSEYDTIAHSARSAFSIMDLHRKVKGFEWGIRWWLDSGFSQLVNLAAMIYMTLYTFIRSGCWWLFFVLLAVNGFVYFAVMRGLNKKMIEIDRENYDRRDMLDEKLKLHLPKLEWRSKSVDEVMVIVREHNQLRVDSDKINLQMEGVNTMIAKVALAFILITVQNNLVGLISVTTMFIGTMLGFFGIISTSRYCEDDLKRLREKLDAAEKQEHPPTLPLPQSWSVVSCNVKKGESFLKLIGDLVLRAGMRILVRGPSGAGKTRFMAALFGLESGIVLSEKLPGNYFGNVKQLYQSIREDLKVENLSLRQVFSDEKDDSVIQRALQLANAGDWVAEKKRAAATAVNPSVVVDVKVTKRDDDYVAIPMGETKVSYLDQKIGRRISGGEKTRLAIAMTIYELEKQGKPILLLDEPEQGSDPPVAYRMIKSILDAFPDRIIFVISHLEKIDTMAGVKWHKSIYVDNGVVQVS